MMNHPGLSFRNVAIRDILLAAGRKEEWDAYLRSLLEKHYRKYKLVPMLKTLQEA